MDTVADCTLELQTQQYVFEACCWWLLIAVIRGGAIYASVALQHQRES